MASVIERLSELGLDRSERLIEQLSPLVRPLARDADDVPETYPFGA